MEAIGYGLYMQMLDRAVAAIRQGKTPNIEAPLDQGVEVSLNLPALIPDDYLHDVQQRLVMYKRIASAQDEAELKELQVELIDRFGLLPAPVKTLLRQTRLRQRAERLGIVRLEAGPDRGRVIFAAQTRVDPMTLVELIQRGPERYRLDGADTLRFEAEMATEESRFQAVEQLLEALNRKVEAA